MTPTPFPQLLHTFFHEWLVQQRNVSHHTVLSYRDSWRLFLRFVAARKTKTVAKLGLTDLTAVEVLAFLQHTEQVRKTSIGTRNCRLAATAQLLQLRRRPGTLGGGPLRRGPAHPDQTSTRTNDPQLERGRGHRHSGPAGSIESPGPPRSRPVGSSLQYRRPHSGGIKSLSPCSSPGIALPGALVWQGTKRTGLSALARNSSVAQGLFEKTASRRRRIYLREPLRTSTWSSRRPLQAETIRGSRGQESSFPRQQASLSTYVSARDGDQSGSGRR